MAVVTFDYQKWAQRFPEFAPPLVTEPMADRFFAEATIFLDNTDGSPISADAPNGPRAAILDLATAHIAQLYAGSQTAPASPLVGRLASAAEGSVNVAVELDPSGQPSRAWWAQTKYGLSVWQATAPYRSAVYVAPPCGAFGAGPPGFPRGW